MAPQSQSGLTTRRSGRAGSFSVINAAALAEISYHAYSHQKTKSHIRTIVNEDDVRAYLLDDGTLLIPGSDSVLDYARYNLRPFRIGGKKYTLGSSDTGQALGGFWHQGFLAHSMVIYKSLKKTPPDFIIGHSMGAASAQILSLLWNVPSIGFAAPRVYLGRASMPAKPLNLSIWRSDDVVGWLPSDKFSHAGHAVELKIASGLPRHKMKHYRRALTDPNFKNAVPNAWPIG